MCLTTRRRFKEYPDQKDFPITEVDRLVYKGLDGFGTRTKGARKGKQHGCSPHRSMNYDEGYHYTEKTLTFNYDPDDKTINVTRGLHAAMTIKKAKDHGWKAIPMIIPAGSIFLLGDDGDVVTNNLIWPDGSKGK